MTANALSADLRFNRLNRPDIHSPEHQWNVPNQMNLFTCFPLEAQHFWFVSEEDYKKYK